MVVGGSEGICKQMAVDFAEKGAKVTIMARTESKLQNAVEEITRSSKQPKGSVRYVQIDVTKNETVLAAFLAAEEALGDIDVLLLGAGKAYPGYILDQALELFERSIDLNYLGSVRCVKAALPLMLKSATLKGSRKQICFIGSTCSVLGFLGYGSYSPTKFALKGFADTLRNEISGSGVSVSFAFPPDTDTPGFKEENKTKPKENTEMFPPEVFSAKTVSRYLIDGLEREEYVLLNPDLGQNLLIASMSGLTTRNRWAPLFIGLSPLIHVILLVLRFNCDRIASKYGSRLLSSAGSKKAN